MNIYVRFFLISEGRDNRPNAEAALVDDLDGAASGGTVDSQVVRPCPCGHSVLAVPLLDHAMAVRGEAARSGIRSEDEEKRTHLEPANATTANDALRIVVRIAIAAVADREQERENQKKPTGDQLETALGHRGRSGSAGLPLLSYRRR